MTSDDIVLKVEDLYVNFYTYEGVVHALDGVNFELRRGDTMGLVGETGCGKSVTSKAILRLIDPPGRIESGRVLLYLDDPSTGQKTPVDILQLPEKKMLEIRGNKIGIVFQDPATYPNPVFKIGDQIAEVIQIHQDLSRDALLCKIEELEKLMASSTSSSRNASASGQTTSLMNRVSPERVNAQIEQYRSMLDNPPKPDNKSLKMAAKRRAIQMLRMVKMPAPERVAEQYPHEMSGGMRQRALIAMALASDPLVLICDEATTALDVTVQAQVLRLLNELKTKVGSSIIIITHDLGIVAETCNRVTVMYAGTVIESTSVCELFGNPMHPYTIGLLKAVPKLHEQKEKLDQIPGSVPNLITPPPGCRFHPRCSFATDICKREKPELIEIRPDHKVACHHPQGKF
ncbi:MAG: ABC transporter ATP-binding protein [Candidatus Thorarchaeota archaeon]